MTCAPTEIEIAAIVAAYTRLRGVPAAPNAAESPRWRLAGRALDAADASDVRTFARGSAWRNASRPV